MSGLQSVEELQTTLQEYRGQLQQVEELLLLQPENEELSSMYNDLAEVIQLTEELLRDATASAAPASYPSAAPVASTSAPAPAAAAAGPVAQIVTPPQLNLPSILPASVADQIRRAQIKAALTGQAPPAWAIGAKCQALYSDGEWYMATVEAVSVNGNFIVTFDGYEGKEEVLVANVKPPAQVHEVYQHVVAPVRKKVEDLPVVTEIPKWLEVKETDDEKTKLRKKKLLKSYKSKIRFQNMDLVQKEKADNWQNFVSGKGSKKKVGLIAGPKKKSMFSVSENGKVGVVGSGRGMTDYKKPARHEFAGDDD